MCEVTGRKPIRGRSYALRGIAKKKKGIGLKITGITTRSFNPNLKTKRLYWPEEGRFVTLRLSMAALRSIDKRGLDAVLRDMKRKAK